MTEEDLTGIMSVESSDADLELVQAVAMATALSTPARVMWQHYCLVQAHEPLMAAGLQRACEAAQTEKGLQRRAVQTEEGMLGLVQGQQGGDREGEVVSALRVIQSIMFPSPPLPPSTLFPALSSLA